MAKTVLQEMNIVKDELAAVSSIRPNKYNPNRQSEDEFYLLVRSIMEDGFTDAVILNTDRTIIDGEHRWTAAIVLNHLVKNKLPVTTANCNAYRSQRDQIIDDTLKIPVKILDKDEIQRRISTQRHNKARGHDDIELASQMMRELEAMGGLSAAMEGLDMTNEEAERLLAYGDSILDHFPGDAPSLSWEPQTTAPGTVASWRDDETHQAQSVSKAASTPVANPVKTGIAGVPGMNINNLSTAPVERPPLMARRIYVMLDEEAKIVDKALGKEAATVLVKLCKDKLKEEDNGSKPKTKGDKK